MTDAAHEGQKFHQGMLKSVTPRIIEGPKFFTQEILTLNPDFLSTPVRSSGAPGPENLKNLILKIHVLNIRL